MYMHETIQRHIVGKTLAFFLQQMLIFSAEEKSCSIHNHMSCQRCAPPVQHAHAHFTARPHGVPCVLRKKINNNMSTDEQRQTK
jgi:hypothetical protein